VKIIYLLSSRFSYSALVSADAGPQYAQDIGIPCTHLNAYQWPEECITVVDPRLDGCELAEVQSRALAGHHVVFRMVDPGFRTEGLSALTLAVLASARGSRSLLLLSYSPAEATQLASTIYGSARTFVLPYVYRDERELQGVGKRATRVCITGCVDPEVYPLRHLALYKRRRSLTWRRMSEVLCHPGYKDLGARWRHEVIGEQYIRYLSRFEMMLLCPSRFEIELQKVRECGYAGCCPVGLAASTFTPEMVAPVVRLSTQTWRSDVRQLRALTPGECRARAMEFRAALRRDRDPDALRNGLFSWLSGQYKAHVEYQPHDAGLQVNGAPAI
jgi:hypothetical protein